MLDRKIRSYLVCSCFWLFMSNRLGAADFFPLFILETNQAVDLMAEKHHPQGSIIKVLSFPDLWKYLFASHHSQINKNIPCLIKSVRRQSKKDRFFYCVTVPHSLAHPLQRIYMVHEEYEHQRSENCELQLWILVYRIWCIIWHAWKAALPGLAVHSYCSRAQPCFFRQMLVCLWL